MGYFAEISKEQLQDILKDVGTDEQSLKRDVNYVIDWLEKSPYLPSVKDEVFLSSVIIRSKNRMEKVKQFLDYYYSRRTLGTDMFSCRNIQAEEFQSAKAFVSFAPSTRLTPEGYRICTFTFGDCSGKDLPKFSSILSLWQMEQEVLMKSDTSKALISIMDGKYFGVSAAALFLVNMKKLLELKTKTTKFRYNETYIVNIRPAGQKFVDMTKHLLSGKLLGRMHVWNRNPEELAEVLPKNALPSDFGGNDRSVDELRDAWYEHMEQFAGWFKSEENVRAELDKRPRDDSISQEFLSFGSSGSFRKVNFD